MRMYDIIMKKRNGGSLSRTEIEYFVKGYVSGTIPDYQASALLMAIFFQGMTREETADLTMAMVHSGDVVDLSSIHGTKVDKHSTGGVGDTTTLVLAPLVAACGVPVAKMSGRGLGHTGGTLDKLESIPGFCVHQTVPDFIDIVNQVGVAVIGQTGDLVPADKMLYALRDVTATVDHISLIASSIMSKKIAAGTDAIVLDVKAGNGAFMQSIEDAFALAEEMVHIGKQVGRKTTALVTDMNQPLGMAVGNALEVKEAIEVLKGIHRGPLMEVCLLLGAYMLYTAGRCRDVEEARSMLADAWSRGEGLEKFKEMVRAQGGEASIVDDPEGLPKARTVLPVKADREGYVTSIQAQSIGISALLLGAGRSTKEDRIDPAVGIIMKKRRGDRVQEGEVIAEFHVNREDKLEEAVALFNEAITIGNTMPEHRPLVYGVITDRGIEKWY